VPELTSEAAAGDVFRGSSEATASCAGVASTAVHSALPDTIPVLVEVELEDPDGAPVLACMMRCKDSGPWTLATRKTSSSSARQPSFSDDEGKPSRFVPMSRWSAVLPTPRDSQRCTLSLKAANAVGWSTTREHKAIPIRRRQEGREQHNLQQNLLQNLQQQQQQQLAINLPRPSSTESVMRSSDASGQPLSQAAENVAFGSTSTLHLVASQVSAMLALQEKAQERMVGALHEAVRHNDSAFLEIVSTHSKRLGNRILLLQDVVQHMDPSASLAGGREIVAQLQLVLSRGKVVPESDNQKAAAVLALLLRGYIWLERSWRGELQTMMKDIAKARGSIPECGDGVLAQWTAQAQAWSETFRTKVAEALPEGLARASQLLATLASGRPATELEHVRADLDACLTLVSAAERQLSKLKHSHRILFAAEASRSHEFDAKGSALRKVETTALGLLTMLVLPMPGTMEIGALHIGMLWLSGDDSGSHVAVEHPTGQPLAPMLERLGSAPPPRAAVILAGWAGGGHAGVVLVHNATARRIIVTVLPGEQDTIVTKTVARLAEAHPYVRGAQLAMSQKEGGDSVAVITPTDVALIQVPQQNVVRLEFSYGTASYAEKAVGRASLKPGCAVSFMCLDGGLQIHNNNDGDADLDDSSIKIVNNDLSPVSVALYRPRELRKHFEGAISTVQIRANEERKVSLPQPCIGCIFEMEVRREDRKCECCEVRPGQRLTIDSTG